MGLSLQLQGVTWKNARKTATDTLTTSQIHDQSHP
jgi:hypothetical protein